MVTLGVNQEHRIPEINHLFGQQTGDVQLASPGITGMAAARSVKIRSARRDGPVEVKGHRSVVPQQYRLPTTTDLLAAQGPGLHARSGAAMLPAATGGA